MNFLARQIFLSFILPALVTGILLFLFLWRRRHHSEAGTVWQATALAAGFIAGHYALFGLPRFMVVGLSQALPLLTVVFTVWAAVEIRIRLPGFLRWLGRATLTLLPAYVLVKPGWIPLTLTPEEGSRLAIYALAMLGLWTALSAVARHARTPWTATAWLITTLGLSAALLLARTASLSQLATVFTAGWASVTFFSRLNDRINLLSLTPIVALIWFSLGTLGSVYDLPLSALALLISAAMTPALFSLLPPDAKFPARIAGTSSRFQMMVALFTSLVLAAGAVFLTFRRFGAPMPL